jgi:hypothetical protein
MTAKIETTATQVNRCTDKTTGKFLGYVVASRSGNEPHEITWNADESRWQCTCMAGQNHMQCHAVKAVNSIILARRADAEADRRQHGALNGSREFSLMR